jgi:hypothetical protein
MSTHQWLIIGGLGFILLNNSINNSINRMDIIVKSQQNAYNDLLEKHKNLLEKHRSCEEEYKNLLEKHKTKVGIQDTE